MPDFFKDLPVFLLTFSPLGFFGKLLFAAALGALLAFHPCHVKKFKTKPKRLSIAKAQILICLAGTVMILVIGDSIARAFGLFGLGSFIRFRTALKNAMDTALIFILIAIGMAVGVGMYGVSIGVVLFLYLLLFILDRIRVAEPAPLEDGKEE